MADAGPLIEARFCLRCEPATVTRGDAPDATEADDASESVAAEERVARSDDGSVQVDPGTADDRDGESEPEFGWPGYLLLGVMVVALVIAPLVVYLRPPQLSWRFTLIVLPLVPALVMAAVAVWATTRA